MTQTFNPKKTLEYELKVGDFLKLREEFFLVAYAGMPSKDVFSMFYFLGEMNANMFYPISKKEMSIYERKFEILSVDAEKIKLKYSGEK